MPGGPRLVIAKPTTYMNLLGAPSVALAQFYKIPPAQIIALHDELDLDFGTIRVKIGGGEGGHNGLRSISKSLSTKDYVRVRFGISRPPGRQDPADYVLSDFSGTERKELGFLVDRAADIAESVVTIGVEPTQNKFH
jgi:PTH1 family peptidyl-tRNA hydrolase